MVKRRVAVHYSRPEPRWVDMDIPADLLEDDADEDDLAEWITQWAPVPDDVYVEDWEFAD